MWYIYLDFSLIALGLKLAIKAHSEGRLEEACEQYKRALNQNLKDPILYQNYGALLRNLDKSLEAETIYRKGIELFPDHHAIIMNYANLIKDDRPSKSLELYLQSNRISLKADSSALPPAAVPTINLLRELNFNHWGVSLSKYFISLFRPNTSLLVASLLICDQLTLTTDSCDEDLANSLSFRLNKLLNSSSKRDQIDVCIALANHKAIKGCNQEAHQFAQQAYQIASTYSPSCPEDSAKLRKLLDINSWNLSCSFLQNEEFKIGWRLFDYGLQTPCEGHQRWQRALAKPFNSSQLPLWNGKSLKSKRLLVLEEQAIGDVMMFLTLLPTIINEASSVGLLLGDRLRPIYDRSFSQFINDGRLTIWSHSDFKAGKLLTSDYDFQIPIGSICQHRFTSISDYRRHEPLIKHDTARSALLREEYLSKSSDPKNTLLVGLSWRGGGKGKRIKQKSIPLSDFESIISGHRNILFVSLQYGEVESEINSLQSQGIPIILDKRINPLKNMDAWIDQVAACDAVISVANTTIHGAGGLRKPTMCLLSQYSDWRWFKSRSVTKSYWYSSVGVAHFDPEYSWEPGRKLVRSWLEERCPLPQGLISVKV